MSSLEQTGAKTAKSRQPSKGFLPYAACNKKIGILGFTITGHSRSVMDLGIKEVPKIGIGSGVVGSCYC